LKILLIQLEIDFPSFVDFVRQIIIHEIVPLSSKNFTNIIAVVDFRMARVI